MENLTGSVLNKFCWTCASSGNRTRALCLGSTCTATILHSQNFTGFSKIILAQLVDFWKKLTFPARIVPLRYGRVPLNHARKN